mmetsp:Transcript_230/g.432  ORF Transcript_230/g.432 Transcript_230/m.432 type:complete len:288 (-) Transcript_230:614-1477(-)|eukprot:scaffold6420_cov168-Amphora_coffeaeformis.AAC.30
MSTTIAAREELLQSTKQALASLNVRREALESEASAITSELTSPLESGGPPMGVDTPLVDSDGYPRSDIDVYRARTLRGRLATIGTDHKQIMCDIEMKLQQLAALQKPQRVAEEKAEIEERKKPKPKPKYDPVTGKWVVKNWDGTIAGAGSDKTPRSFDSLEALSSDGQAASSNVRQSAAASVGGRNTTVAPSLPFAKVNAVAPHSPAEAAGLLEDDLILRFGSITIDSPNGFQELAQAVPNAASDHQTIEILVKRGNAQQETKTVHLVPRPWEGRGLIGCHIVPFQN